MDFSSTQALVNTPTKFILPRFVGRTPPLKCVNSTIQEMRKQCPNQLSWRGDSIPCIVRYSDRPLLGELLLSPIVYLFNTANITSDMQQFDKTWESLMATVLRKASNGSSNLKFATGNTGLTLFQRIYTLMQCTPDLTNNNCNQCLRDVVTSFRSRYHGKQGGVVYTPSCYFRWELYPFYDSSLDDSPPPPSLQPLPPTVLNPSPKRGQRRNSSPTIILVVITSIIFVVLLVLSCFIFLIRKQKGEAEAADDIMTVKSLRFDFGSIRAATNDFSDDNKLGQGGFGIVYRGRHSNGEAIAVKRLSKDSGQGEVEFKNEVLLLARLEHRNLVRLLGFCLEKKERILIYELLTNSSLDNYLFDRATRRILDWGKRYKIIRGIARGLLYLHEDSRLRIIHRDLKASNILLDEEMNPKISDFGMARLFEVDQSQDETRRIVGTLGYMAPEYARHGHFSVKSDVFSFGVLVLEIISGKRNTSFCSGEEGESLLTYAWKKWNEGRAANLIDKRMRRGSRSEMMRCINIGLLCVQENEADRPTMASVDVMLSSNSMTLNVPSKPAFFIYTTIEPHHLTFSSSLIDRSQESNRDPMLLSVNEVSISELYPR